MSLWVEMVDRQPAAEANCRRFPHRRLVKSCDLCLFTQTVMSSANVSPQQSQDAKLQGLGV